MATQMQLEVILTGNRIAVSCKAEKTTESMKTKTESENMSLYPCFLKY